MAKVKLSAGAELDLLTKGELDDSLHDAAQHEWSERGRGIKKLRFRLWPGAALTTSAGYVFNQTPLQGYVWNLRFAAASLSGAQTVQFYLGTDTSTGTTSNTTLVPLANCASAVIGSASWGSGQVWMEPDEYLVVWAGGSATLNALHVTAVEAPAELAWKLT